MEGDPLIEVQVPGARIIFMMSADENPEFVEIMDVQVIADDGSRWSATIMTLAEIEHAMRRWEKSGECLDGRYFFCSDLLVVRDRGISRIAKMLEDMIVSGEYRDALKRLDDSD